MTFVGVSSFAAPAEAAKPSRIHLSISIPQSTIESTLEEAVPAKIESADENKRYGLRLRNLKISRRHFKFEWGNGQFQITAPATARFQIKLGVLTGWEDITAEIVAGVRIRPSVNQDWALAANSTSIFKITQIESIGVPQAADFVSSWLRDECIQPQIDEIESALKQSDIIKDLVEQGTTQLAEGIKVGRNWEQVDVQMITTPVFHSGKGFFTCSSEALASVKTPQKRKPANSTWKTPTLTAKKLPDERLVAGSLDATPNPDQTTDQWDVNIKVNLNEPANVSGNATMRFKPIDIDALFDQASN
jgi:hypothetical protein